MGCLEVYLIWLWFHHAQGFRERLLADPKFLNRLAIEEAISITTTLIAQYERRKENFFEELDYVITDSLRGIVVDFFTVWLPAPTLSFLSNVDDVSELGSIEALKGLLGSIPDNAFQKNLPGRDWNLNHRIASVLIGGLKLAGVGFISSIGAVASSNILYAIRRLLSPNFASKELTKRSPILKTAVVYGSFLGTSANLRYQVSQHYLLEATSFPLCASFLKWADILYTWECDALALFFVILVLNLRPIMLYPFSVFRSRTLSVIQIPAYTIYVFCLTSIFHVW